MATGVDEPDFRQRRCADAHVVGDAELVKVRFPDGATYGTSRVVARDWLVDMALIEIPGTRPVPMAVGAQCTGREVPNLKQQSRSPYDRHLTSGQENRRVNRL